jgi:L-rhamnose-H+ transport protein
MDGFLLGVVLVVIAGALEGLFSLPLTRTPQWKWENVWGLGSLIALVAVPWPMALLSVNDLIGVYEQVPAGILFLVLLAGIGWGLGGIFWGKAISAVGMALGVSLLMGLINVFGSIGPMAISDPAKLTTKGGLTLIVAMAVMIVGVIFIAIAGKFKEQELAVDKSGEQVLKSSTPFMIGLLFCLLSGFLSALVNFGFIYGGQIAETAAKTGTSEWAKGLAIWALVFTGNYLVNFLYALHLMIKNKTTGLIFSQGTPAYWLWVTFMGLAWPGGVVIYGIAAYKMGAYGAYVGFPMMLLCAILFGNLAGALTGEWKGTSAKPKTIMVLGVLVLFVAFAMLGWSNKLMTVN